ncbi:heme/hemin ABC transporter substrate-binding protein [Rhodohalobacter mucosus]|uniref:Hemin ABC transporter substrate-binding protein n=1 Tax=Rhodohalobacter mucosus TaxID=2079485 RepID=A0A316TSS8_9BACT|nr:ABC transporter substrate-binding protein [Rhodohalobacter mucosus]PWN07673.1 hemin ABC transporter substrate-binding protein [Rhodohalobacter mucosus]
MRMIKVNVIDSNDGHSFSKPTATGDPALVLIDLKTVKTCIVGFLLIVLTASALQARQVYSGSDGIEVDISDKTRIVSIGSAVTETIFALGAEDYLIAVDESSTYPTGAERLPKVSFTRNLSAEGVLSFAPSLILASGAAGPPTAIQQIRSTGTPMLLLNADESVDGALERIRELGDILNRENEALKVMSALQADLDRAERLRNSLSSRPKVLFIYARGPNNLTVAGNRTSAKAMIDLAGGVNAFNSFDGYKPLTAEAVVQANPDVILMMNSGVESVGGEQGVLRAPGISLTSAGENRRIYSMEGTYLLGFGPRLGQAVLDLMSKIHPQAEI